MAVVAYREAGMQDAAQLKCSLRSVGGGGPGEGEGEDTTVVSEAYGGGGHRNASSFLLADAAEFESWRRLEGEPL